MADRPALFIPPKPTADQIAAARDVVSLAQIMAGMEIYQRFDSSAELPDVPFEDYATMRAQQIIEEKMSLPTEGKRDEFLDAQSAGFECLWV